LLSKQRTLFSSDLDFQIHFIGLDMVRFGKLLVQTIWIQIIFLWIFMVTNLIRMGLCRSGHWAHENLNNHSKNHTHIIRRKKHMTSNKHYQVTILYQNTQIKPSRSWLGLGSSG